jgi:hypothetical protein
MVLILECRSHLDLGDLPNLLAAELGVMTVRLERAIRSLDGVARVHVNRWGDGSAHLHMWFLARPYGQLQLRGTFLSLWDDILPRIPEQHWRENLAMVAAWLAEFGGRAIAEPPHIQWQSPATFSTPATAADTRTDSDVHTSPADTHGAGGPGDGGQAAPEGGNGAERYGAVGSDWNAGLGSAGAPFASGDASDGETADGPARDVAGTGETDRTDDRDATHDSSQDGIRDSNRDGFWDGSGDGARDGSGDGARDGSGDGARDGSGDSARDSSGDGARDGSGDSARDSSGDGARDSSGDGVRDGSGDSARVGDRDGDRDGRDGDRDCDDSGSHHPRDSAVSDHHRAAVPRQIGHDSATPVGSRDVEDRAAVDQAGVREAEGSARP